MLSEHLTRWIEDNGQWALAGLALVCVLLLVLVLLKLTEMARLARRRRKLSDQLTQAYEQHRHQRGPD